MKARTKEEFRELLVNVVKGVGQDIIENAEDIVGIGNIYNDFDIRITIPIEDGRYEIGSTPELEINRGLTPKRAIDAMLNHWEKYNPEKDSDA